MGKAKAILTATQKLKKKQQVLAARKKQKQVTAAANRKKKQTVAPTKKKEPTKKAAPTKKKAPKVTGPTTSKKWQERGIFSKVGKGVTQLYSSAKSGFSTFKKSAGKKDVGIALGKTTKSSKEWVKRHPVISSGAAGIGLYKVGQKTGRKKEKRQGRSHVKYL